MASDPCHGDQTTTYFASDGSSHVERPKVPAKPPIDCFYVYPTVSNQPTPNATQSPDPEVRSIAVYQAQRFSTRCRVFVPLYRQVTAAGVAVASQTHDTSGYETAFADVREAWLDYLRQDNHGRGVVLVGHSQGSRMLRALIRREIDPNPAVRDLLVSAIIPGANATVAKGSRVGGDFQNVPACDTAAQTGCVISYSTFNKVPPSNARFGRTDTDPVAGALDLPTGPGLEVLCVDPAALAGSAELRSLLPSEPFAPGVIALLLLRLYGGPPPTADTPWLQPSDHYTGRCETSNGANVLMISPVDGARTLTPSPDDTWGVHLVDLNIALGNLVEIVGVESAAWRSAHRPRKR
jgi:pimeloyl-ACP methyl ester carboxylesterase